MGLMARRRNEGATGGLAKEGRIMGCEALKVMHPHPAQPDPILHFARDCVNNAV